MGRAINTHLGPQDFSKVAQSLGRNDHRIDSFDAFKAALSDALSADAPSVIDCAIDVSDALIVHEKPELITLGFKELTMESR